jgi:hypothetical protein
MAMNTSQRECLRAFGLSFYVEGAVPPGAWEPRPQVGPALELRIVGPQAMAKEWSGRTADGWSASIDGARFAVERGIAGDHRFVHGGHPDKNASAEPTIAVFHLDAGMKVLSCAPADPSELSWWRVALDSVLFTVALLKGYEALHAGAIADQAGAIAITAASGGGKSTLLLELVQRGLQLMADDVLILEPRAAGAPLVHPAPPLMTVPTAQIKPPKATDGRQWDAPQRICEVGEESWIAARVGLAPLPLHALVVLDRRAGARLTIERIREPLAPLLNALLGYPRTDERERARFEMASTIACETVILRLTADLDTTPAALAEALIQQLERIPRVTERQP